MGVGPHFQMQVIWLLSRWFLWRLRALDILKVLWKAARRNPWGKGEAAVLQSPTPVLILWAQMPGLTFQQMLQELFL